MSTVRYYQTESFENHKIQKQKFRMQIRNHQTHLEK